MRYLLGLLLFVGCTNVTQARTLDEYGQMTMKEFVSLEYDDWKDFMASVKEAYGEHLIVRSISDAMYQLAAKRTDWAQRCQDINSQPARLRENIRKFCSATLNDTYIYPIEKAYKDKGLL